VSSLFSLISWKFLKWVLLANVIAWLLAYKTMTSWLEEFAYRIELNWDIFVLAGLTALGIALQTVGFKVLKSALRNPVDTLRSE